MPVTMLVGDGAEGLAPLLGGGLAVVPRAEQHDFLAGRHRLVAEVDDELIHAHRARDGPPAAARGHQRPSGRRARHAVRVAERHQPERGLAVGDVPVAVGHAGAGRHPLDQGQPGAQRHGRPQPGRRAARQGGHAVQAAAEPHQVQPGAGHGQRGRGVGDVPDLGRDARLLGVRDRVGERRELGGDRRVPGQVGAGEMGPQAGDLQPPGGLGGQGGVDQPRASPRGWLRRGSARCRPSRCSRAGTPARAAASATRSRPRPRRR